MGLVSVGGLANPFHVSRHLTSPLPRHVVQAVPGHMHDAQLHAGARVNRLGGIGEALQANHAGDEDALHAAIAQFGHHLQPELAALAPDDPQAEPD